MTFARDVCEKVLRKRFDNFDTLAEGREVLVKDEATHVAAVASALALTSGGLWRDGAPAGFEKWLVEALFILQTEMLELGDFNNP